MPRIVSYSPAECGSELHCLHPEYELCENNRARRLIDEYQHLYQLSYYQPNLQSLKGLLALTEGKGELVFKHYLEGLQTAYKMEFRLQALLALEGCAWALAASGQANRAAFLLGAAGEFRQRLGAVVFPRDRPVHERTITGLRSILGEARYDSLWREGYQVGFEQGVREVKD